MVWNLSYELKILFPFAIALLYVVSGVGGLFPSWWPVATFSHVNGPFIFKSSTIRDVKIIPSFPIWGYVLHVVSSLNVANISDHPFSFVSCSLGFFWGKHDRIYYSYLWSFLLKFCFSILCSLYFMLFLQSLLLLSGWVVIAVSGSMSVQGIS